MQFLITFGILLFGSGAVFADDNTTVHFGPILSETIQWVAAAFGTAFATGAVAAVFKLFKYLGIQVADAQKTQLQAIIVNGLNDAAAKAEIAVAVNPSLNVDVKSKIVSDAIAYTQAHGAETIKALGLDPASGAAVEAIKARIATAVADPATPTPAVLGGSNGVKA